jgi:DNA-directed RNA polymerase subunit delta
MSTGKPRIAKDYDKLSADIINQIKLEYPFGFEDNLISYKDAKGNKISALPFEAEDVYYLVKMTKLEAQQIIEDDEDYDDEGNLREDFAEDVESSDSEEEEEDDSYDKNKAEDDGGEDED